jgi:hypothetical protein
MSLVDTIGPAILLGLLGLAVVIGAATLCFGAVERVRQHTLRLQAEADRAQAAIEVNDEIRKLIWDLVVYLDDPLSRDALPKPLTDRLVAAHLDLHHRKELTR